MRAEPDVASLNARFIWHPMVDPKLPAQYPPLIIEKGEGCYVSDLAGRRFIDCTAGLWNVNVGHRHPEVIQAIVEQLGKLEYYGSFANLSNVPSILLSKRVIDMMAPEGMRRIMFSSGGSDAIETGIKLARQYWKLMGQPEKTKIFSLKLGYHGVHFGGMAASGSAVFRRPYEPMMPGFHQIDAPYLYRNPWTDDPDRLEQIVADTLEREIQYHGADTVAAFLAEPVQGVGGVIVPPGGLWRRFRDICDRHGVLLIADEVITAFGRTGSMFGTRGWGVAPDIMCIAKGISSGYVPLGATVVNGRVAAAWEQEHPLCGIMHGYTYSGHPVACAAALSCLDIVERDDLPGNAASVGAYFLQRLDELRAYDTVGDVRGKGLMLAVELVQGKAGKLPFSPTAPYLIGLYESLLAKGAMARIAGSKIILSPPLIFTRSHVEEAMTALHAAFQDLHRPR
jgi:putrescine---pyruvate transaminase